MDQGIKEITSYITTTIKLVQDFTDNKCIVIGSAVAFLYGMYPYPPGDVDFLLDMPEEDYLHYKELVEKVQYPMPVDLLHHPLGGGDLIKLTINNVTFTTQTPPNIIRHLIFFSQYGPKPEKYPKYLKHIQLIKETLGFS